jgi:hypothetical protein
MAVCDKLYLLLLLLLFLLLRVGGDTPLGSSRRSYSSYGSVRTSHASMYWRRWKRWWRRRWRWTGDCKLVRRAGRERRSLETLEGAVLCARELDGRGLGFRV